MDYAANTQRYRQLYLLIPFHDPSTATAPIFLTGTTAVRRDVGTIRYEAALLAPLLFNRWFGSQEQKSKSNASINMIIGRGE